MSVPSGSSPVVALHVPCLLALLLLGNQAALGGPPAVTDTGPSARTKWPSQTKLASAGTTREDDWRACVLFDWDFARVHVGYGDWRVGFAYYGAGLGVGPIDVAMGATLLEWARPVPPLVGGSVEPFPLQVNMVYNFRATRLWIPSALYTYFERTLLASEFNRHATVGVGAKWLRAPVIMGIELGRRRATDADYGYSVGPHDFYFCGVTASFGWRWHIRVWGGR